MQTDIVFRWFVTSSVNVSRSSDLKITNLIKLLFNRFFFNFQNLQFMFYTKFYIVEKIRRPCLVWRLLQCIPEDDNFQVHCGMLRSRQVHKEEILGIKWLHISGDMVPRCHVQHAHILWLLPWN